jgi:Family of unknown function (DUF6082)
MCAIAKWCYLKRPNVSSYRGGTLFLVGNAQPQPTHRKPKAAVNENNMNELGEPLTSGKSFTQRKPIVRKVTIYLVALLAITGLLSLILVSPLLLRQLAQIKGIDWTELSNIGQTYGAVSAILSAVALIGITISLVIQARQARTERVRITRERQMELLRIILDLVRESTGAAI